MRTFQAAFALFVLASGPLAAQSNAERIANDHYTRSHDYDLLHQRIEVRDFHWDSLTFEGRVTVRLRALRPAFDSVVLDAGKLLDIVAIRPERGQAVLGFSRAGDTLVVRLPRPLRMGDTTAFTIQYHGRVKNGHGLTFIDADSGPPARPRQIWSQGEDDNNHDWFPTYDFPNDKMTWELVATVPKGYAAISNGSLTLDQSNRDGTRTMGWRQDRPSATYLVSLIVAPLVKVTDHWRKVPVDYYVYRADSARARPLFRVTPDMIEVYSRLTGTDYPWAKYAQTTVADFFGGMENVSATTLVDWLPDARAYADRPWYQYILIPHELAHQWFGDLVTTANWANMWLNEGFAEFMPGQYWAVKNGAHAADDYYLDEYEQFLGIDRERRMPLASLGSNNIYPKGALVLRMLLKYLGPDRFWAGINRYLRDHAYDVATSDDLRQAFLAATGENLDWFWDQWVYQAGYPEFSVQAAWDSAAGTLNLTVRQEQQDTLAADSTGLRFTVPDVFHMPVTVRVGTSTGDVVFRTRLESKEQTLQIPGITAPPTMVIFDDGNTILKRLSFPEPTEWLAEQLRRDPDLWNRAWVIAQLAERKDDPTALEALGTAATGSDYFLTRSQAARALAAFDDPKAAAALLAALRDSSAQVRVAAAQSLGGFATDTVVAAIRGAWQGDTSYAVRAAALGTLARLDQAHAQPLIREGLRTPSYRDVIQDAALVAIFQAGDTTMLDDVDGVMGVAPNAPFVLAAFAGRGNQRALSLLESHLTAPRVVVRKRVLEAFRFAMPPALARERLTVKLAEVQDPRVREEIAEALGRIKP